MSTRPAAERGGPAGVSGAPRILSGVDAMRGIGLEPAQGFWTDAWGRVVRRRGAVMALGWLSVVGFFAVFAPLLANGHPLVWRELDASGAVARTTSPLWNSLSAADLLILLMSLVAGVLLVLPLRTPRGERLGILLVTAVQMIATCALSAIGPVRRAVSFASEGGRETPSLVGWLALACVVAIPFLWISPLGSLGRRMIAVGGAAVACALALTVAGGTSLVDFDRYVDRQRAGEATAVYTIVPWSPAQRRTDTYFAPPMTTLGEQVPTLADTPIAKHRFVLGTDSLGQDVLSQMLHACRLAISIGFVSTGLAVVIGVTLGALMGYFGGWVDLLLARVIEIFMAIPVLFLLIVAAGVLPRNTYVMMAIIGCVTWTGAARFTRAEFLRLRNQDFVQAARALGLPLRSVLFRHMLPNGVTPVLVDASFAIAAAILAEATLSYLGLGPDGQASWGRLLSSSTNTIGEFLWWLAIFPGAAIFLTVLSYNLLGEAMRDAIDPKLRKAGN